MRVYKRTGHRVFIKKMRIGTKVQEMGGSKLAGDIIVRPSWIGLSVLQVC